MAKRRCFKKRAGGGGAASLPPILQFNEALTINTASGKEKWLSYAGKY